jgi:uncharacterized protein (DUF1810 family)
MAASADPYRLERFVEAQSRHDAFVTALAELRRGRKTSHWMWFVFPQIAGLGHSPVAQTYAVASLDEARAYLAHPVLGPRLRDCARALTELGGATAEDVFGSIDAMKLRSSMTLFHRAASEEPLFGQVLDQYYGGTVDDQTDRLLAAT